MQNLKPYEENLLNFKNPQFKGYNYYDSRFHLPKGTTMQQIKNFAQEKSNILRVEGNQQDGFFQIAVKFSNGKWKSSRGTRPGYAVSTFKEYDNEDEKYGAPLELRLIYTGKK